jgi:hypothetical protein
MGGFWNFLGYSTTTCWFARAELLFLTFYRSTKTLLFITKFIVLLFFSFKNVFLFFYMWGNGQIEYYFKISTGDVAGVAQFWLDSKVGCTMRWEGIGKPDIHGLVTSSKDAQRFKVFPT